MPRPNKPWFRAATDWWMVKIDGRQLKLAKGKKHKTAALKKFHELMAAWVGERGRRKGSEKGVRA